MDGFLSHSGRFSLSLGSLLSLTLDAFLSHSGRVSLSLGTGFSLTRYAFLSHSCTINQAPFVSVSSPTENYSELSYKTSRQKNGVPSSARGDWLIAVCHSNLGDTLISSRINYSRLARILGGGAFIVNFIDRSSF